MRIIAQMATYAGTKYRRRCTISGKATGLPMNFPGAFVGKPNFLYVSRSPVSEPDFKEWRAATRSFSTLAGYFHAPGGSGADLTGRGTPEKLEGALVTEDFFPTLRVPAMVGRTFSGAEADDPGDYNLVLSYASWRKRFNGDPSIIGTALTLDGTPYTVVNENVARPKLLAWLLFVFGLMGLLLGALAIYGVLAFTVSQRRREIGVRVALGATPKSVLGMVLRQGMTLALVGVAAGIIGALIVTRVMSAVLYDVQTTDPATFAAVIAVLLAAALVASWLPARRALRVDPMQALRYD